MPSLIDIRRRIRSVKNTQQITKAMKMVATARLRRAQDRVVNARPFSRMLGELLKNVSSAAAGDERLSGNPLLAVRPEKKVQLVLITADRGLAGAFNTNLIKEASRFLAESGAEGKTVQMELYGRKAVDFFSRRPVSISNQTTGISQMAGQKEAAVLAKTVMQRFAGEEVDAVYLLYNEFKSVLSQKVVLKRILPVAVQDEQSEPARDYIFEQDPVEFMNRLLPNYIMAQSLEAFLESAAAEHAARMTAMEAATNNANEVIGKLTLYMNRVRQASITKEIIEVVSGAAALE
jgi:F-type H+-transporting ATPase subunit gamma